MVEYVVSADGVSSLITVEEVPLDSAASAGKADADAVTGERRFIVPGAGPVETLELDPAEGGLGSTVSPLTLASPRRTGAPVGGRAGGARRGPRERAATKTCSQSHEDFLSSVTERGNIPLGVSHLLKPTRARRQVWDSGIALAGLLTAQRSELAEDLSGKRVLELGCGPALPGLAIAQAFPDAEVPPPPP